MKEMEARLAIMAVEELTAAQKLIMLYILTRVDWQDWTGSVSTNDIEQGTKQSTRNIKRSLKALDDLGYIERSIKRRDNGLHHKASIRVCVSLLGDRKSPPMVTESHHEEAKDSDRKSPPMVTESHHSKAKGGDRKSLGVVTDWHEGGDRKSLGVVTDWHEGGDRKSPNNNIDQYNINNKQYNNNREKAEPELESAREDREPSNEEQQRADLWDSIMDDPKPEITEELRDGLWYVSDIYDELDYKRKIIWEINHHERQDIRRALWNHSDGDKLYTKMKHERIAPRSAIDWVGLQAAGHMPAIKTPKAPPQKPTSYTVTPERQAEILAADQAWLNIINSKGNDEW